MSEFNHGQPRPESNTQIACRLCDRIFMNTRELINHIQSHMAADGTISARPQPVSATVNHFQSNLSFRTPSQETRRSRPSIGNNYSVRGNPVMAARNHVATTRIDVPSLLLQSARNNHVFPPAAVVSGREANRREMEQFPRNFAKPYIDQLDKPIPEVVEVVESDDDDKKLELTLKL